jgi:hypothetical protein
MRKRPVISQLESHYSRIRGELGKIASEVVAAGVAGEALQARRAPVAQQHEDMLTHIEACLRLFEPQWTPDHIQPRRARPPQRPLERGDLLNYAYDVLREASAPMSSGEIVEALGRGAGPLSIAESRSAEMRSALTTLLRGQESHGSVQSHGQRPLRWSIIKGRSLEQDSALRHRSLNPNVNFCLEFRRDAEQIRMPERLSKRR